MPIRRLFIPACLCLVTVGATTTVGPETPWPIEAIATSTHAKTKSSKPRRAAGSGATATSGSGAPEPALPATAAKPVVAQPPVPAADKKPGDPAADDAVTVTASAKAHSAHAARAPASEPAHPSTPKATPKPGRKRVVHRSEREICDTLAKSAHTNNLPVPFFIRLLFQESKFEPGAVSHAGAQGIAQFMPETARAVGLNNPFDPLQAIPAAARLLRDFIDQFGNLGLAAAAYNAGPTRVHKWLEKRSALPKETLGYVKTITGKPAESWKSASEGHGDTALPQKAPCKAVSARYLVATVPLPPKPPPAAVRTAHAAKKTAAKHRRTAESAKARAKPDGKTALQLAARRRDKKERD